MQAPDNEFRQSSLLRSISNQPVIGHVVARRLLNDLFSNAITTIVIGLLMACVVFYAVWRTTDNDAIALWLLLVTAVSLARLTIIPLLRRHLDGTRVRAVGWIYTISAGIAGTIWASAVWFDDPGHPIAARLMILVTLIGAPIFSMIANAIYRPVYFAFATPIFVSMIYWAWWKIPDMALEFTLYAVLYASLVSTMAVRFHNNLRRSLMRDIENELLLQEVNSVNDKLQRIAYKDPLTGLSNRRSFEETATDMLSKLREHENLALMLIDMDNLKTINDSLGHAAGDAALVELSRRIERAARQRGKAAHVQMIAARIGGDEFIALFRLDDGSPVEPVASRILNALMKPIEFERKRYRPGVSIGVALAPRNGDNVDELLRAADRAMYQAKGDGGGRFAIAPSVIGSSA